MRSLLSLVRGKLLAHNSTPNLSDMLTLVQRLSNRRSRRTCPTLCKYERKHSDTKTDSGCRPTYRASNSTENARKQVSISQQLNAAAIKQQERPRSKVTFFRCGKPGHIVAIQADAKIVVVERSCDYSG